MNLGNELRLGRLSGKWAGKFMHRLLGVGAQSTPHRHVPTADASG
jgi:hypothetical protein